MTPTLWTIVIGILSVLGAGVAFLLRESHAAGRREAKLDRALDELLDIKKSTGEIPRLSQQVAQHDNLLSRCTSDIRELRNHLLRASRPDLGE